MCLYILSLYIYCQCWHWFLVDKILFLLQKLRSYKSGKRGVAVWFIIRNTPTYSLTVQISLSLTCIHIDFRSMYIFFYFKLQLNNLNQATGQYLSLFLLFSEHLTMSNLISILMTFLFFEALSPNEVTLSIGCHNEG